MHATLQKYQFKRAHLEGFFWMAALLVLALHSPLDQGHSSLCLAKNLDIGFCPGCGLGTSISWLFRGNLSQSFASHPLGLPAVIILIYRIYTIFKSPASITH
jgi:hypothetical protein